MIEEALILSQIIFIDIILAADNAIIIGLIAANFVPKNRKQIIFWGVVGFAAGVFIAWQMVFPALNFNLEWTTFGRLRPIHTSGVIFAFSLAITMICFPVCALLMPEIQYN